MCVCVCVCVCVVCVEQVMCGGKGEYVSDVDHLSHPSTADEAGYWWKCITNI